MCESCVDISTCDREEIQQKSHIFGRDKDNPKLTQYQERINKACEQLCIQEPQLLLSKGERLKRARAKIHEEGYVYKKGYSRSQQYSDATPSQPKRARICKDERDRRIMDISEQMGDLDRLIRIKERRIEEATTTRSFAAADQLAKEVRTYKEERVQLRTELGLLQKKDKRHKSYVQKKQQSAVGSESQADKSEADPVCDLTDEPSSAASNLPAAVDSETPPDETDEGTGQDFQ